MNITIPRQKLLRYLTYTDALASSKTTISILSNVLIDVYEKEFSLCSSNLETGIKIIDTAETSDSGALAVNSKKLLSIIRELPDNDVILVTDEHNRLSIKTTSTDINAEFVIAGVAKDDFPEVNTEPENEYFQLRTSELQRMIRKTLFAISHDENKFSLTGVFLEKTDDGINMVATDGKRLSLVSRNLDELGVSVKGFYVPNDGVIIPRIVFSEVLKFGFQADAIHMGFSKSQIFLRCENVNLTSNLIDGKFPDYKKIIPVEREKYLITNREALYNAIRRVSVLVDENYNQVILNISKNRLLVSTKSPSLGGAAEEIPIEYDGDGIQIALNYVYLMDCLREIDSESVKIDFENTERVITIKGLKEDGFINLIMPMKLGA